MVPGSTSITGGASGYGLVFGGGGLGSGLLMATPDIPESLHGLKASFLMVTAATSTMHTGASNAAGDAGYRGTGSPPSAVGDKAVPFKDPGITRLPPGAPHGFLGTRG